LKTVVLGGYGNFGARICRALHDHSEIEIVVAGRDERRAATFAAELGGRVGHARLDTSQTDLKQALRYLRAELVIHTAGPFQRQGYEVPLAVAAAGAHYIDLADGRRFVCDFNEAANAAFIRQKRLAISGASTAPALSSAVIDYLSKNWQKISTIDFCIAPAQTAPRGVATLSAVLDYCGAPLQVWENGVWKTRYGWANPKSVEFARLQPRIGALCDIPDLELLPQRYAGAHTVMFRAALEIGITQRTLAVMALLRRLGLIRQPHRFAKIFHQTAKGLDRFGSALGGMVVRVTGIDKIWNTGSTRMAHCR
jgi:saccharopine dehydrogenase-like NADP-dependent oxidoreductase